MKYAIKSDDNYYLKYHLSINFPYDSNNYSTKLLDEAKLYDDFEKAKFALEFTSGRFAATNARIIGVEKVEVEL